MACDWTGKTITCRAAVLWGPSEPLSMEEIEVDPPQKLEVRVKILFTSICHTDLGVWKGENSAMSVYPRILGHEASGYPFSTLSLTLSLIFSLRSSIYQLSSSSVVESVGEGVKDLKRGDHVVPVCVGECGDCVYCTSSKTNICDKYRINAFRSTMINDGKTRFYTASARQPIYHFLSTSTFSEYTVLDSACVVKIQPSAPLNKICLLSCGVSTGVGAAWKTANVQEGSTVAVFGLGAVGLAAAEGARIRGASRIIGIDVNPDKFIKAKGMGVTDFVNPREQSIPVHEVIRSMTNGGVDYCFECVGNREVLREAFMSTHDGWGLCVVVGVHSSPELLMLHPMELFDGRRIVGTILGDIKPKSELPDMVEKYTNGFLKVDGLITHELPFEEINTAMKLLADGVSLRCVLSV